VIEFDRAEEIRIAVAPTRTSGPSAARIFVGAVLLPLVVLMAVYAAVGSGAVGRWNTDLLRSAERHWTFTIASLLDTGLKASVVVAVTAVAGLVVVLMARTKWVQALFWAVAVGGVLALDAPLKQLFARPALGGHPGVSSFPSGNAMLSAAVLTAIVLTTSSHRRPVLLVGVPLVIAYGVALVYSWWHYPSDVIGGWCVGIAWVTVWWLALRRANRR
jgi:membrane-associated phospholipid phosphatase